jgi:sigma-B regulation protein RsbU (phosphoserine phosphatase)
VRDAGVVVGVAGDGNGEVHLTSVLPEPLAEGGRGLFVVDSLANEWGSTRHNGSTTVWFRLA